MRIHGNLLCHPHRTACFGGHIALIYFFLLRAEVSIFWDIQSRWFKACDYHFRIESVFNDNLNHREQHCSISWYPFYTRWPLKLYLPADLCISFHVCSHKHNNKNSSQPLLSNTFYCTVCEVLRFVLKQPVEQAPLFSSKRRLKPWGS